MRREVAVTACIPMTRRRVRRTDGFAGIGLQSLGRMGRRRAKRAQDCLGVRTGGKRLRYSRSEHSHQDRKQSDKASELADKATAHEADDGFQEQV
jgi:hypothetical protein